MRIACIATSEVPSRTANSIQLMKACGALAGIGNDVQLWIPGLEPGAPWETLAAHYGLRDRFTIHWQRSLKALRRYDFSLNAVLAARAWEPDLIYTWTLQAAALASRLGRRTLLELHDRPQGRFGPLLFRTFLNGRGARRALYTTHALRQALEAEYGPRFDPPFGQWAPNGVELDRYADLPDPPIARRALGLEEGFTAGYSGHLYQGRGASLMMELALRQPQVQFVWAGGEPEAIGAWRQRLDHAGARNVRLVGFLPNAELPGFHAACDVLLMPYGESIAISGGSGSPAYANPMKAFEYLAAGRPILSSDLPVFREILSDQNAILLPPGDLDSWEAALLRVQRNVQLRAELSERARRDAAAFDWRARAKRALEGLAP